MKKPLKDLLKSNIVWIDVDDFEKMCFDFAIELFEFDQPIPDYSTRNNSALESALATPQQSFGGQLLYPTIVEQGAILFYLMIKNHPFQNGNKRIAVMSLLVFLAINDMWTSFSPSMFYDLAYKVAKSRPAERENVMKDIENGLTLSLIPFPEKFKLK